ncbi:N-acetylmuramoyl-L-alanine amidase [Streptomyces sp. NPDC091292]|uniref:N-acetylmuramoyl-L-alanine amidase n=1 Tax=Streptomyces sp. NPDC091292 TaxID=3365991 RepID=UPI00380ACFF5
MKLVTRAQLGWPASQAPAQAGTKGVKVHYEGSPVSTELLKDHDACVAEVKAIRAAHLANKKENYSDIAYNYLACPHGYLFEGRGTGRRTGANGDQALNRGHYAICALVGSAGLTQPTDAMLSAVRDGIELLRRNGAGDEIKGHRDGYATSCPGEALYAWVRKGAPRPNATAPAPAGGGTKPSAGTPSAGTKTSVSLARLATAARRDPGLKQGASTYPADVRPVEAALRAEGLLAGSYATDGSFGSVTVRAYAQWQRRLGYTGAAADGIPGRASLQKLGAKHGFTVT